jgi:hypothetical protein
VLPGAATAATPENHRKPPQGGAGGEGGDAAEAGGRGGKRTRAWAKGTGYGTQPEFTYPSFLGFGGVGFLEFIFIFLSCWVMNLHKWVNRSVERI